MTQTERANNYKKRHVAKGLCRNCSRPARSGTTRCPRCHAAAARFRKRYLPRLRALRDYKKQLGFCIYCHVAAKPGSSMCTRHLRLSREACNRYREQRAQRRGWRFVKVKV